MNAQELVNAWPDLVFEHLVHAGLGDARDQGVRPTCIAFAVTASHEARRADGIELSSEYLFWASRQRDGLPVDAGYTTVAGVREALKDAGQPADTDWPYDEARTISTAYKPPRSPTTLFKRDSTEKPVSGQVLRTLLSHGLVPVIVIEVTEPDFQRAPNGRVPSGDSSTALGGWLHAVSVVGCGQDSTTDCVVVRNSWGPDWGVGGYGVLTFDYLTLHLQQIIVLN